ncbi:hypothetical protein AALP_AA5G203200 [Arabis alpina]|uniref:WEB family protein n=1 Tax=Arabis alpina TaxID=50452 RepID=A0A087GYB1_ARAAL|nr:hypothetical protein AALP_AA5G203200 [Arabis alpina]
MEAIPGTPRIRDVRIQPGSESFNPVNTRSGRGLRTGFENGGSWGPFMIGDNHEGRGGFDIKRMEENAVELEKELIMKELETLDFLEALGSTRKNLEDLKLELQQQAVRRVENPEHLRTHIKEMNDEHCHRSPMASPDLARMKLGKTMDDLAMIQSYAESLNMNTEEEKYFLGEASLAEELNSLRFKPSGLDQGERFNTDNLPVKPQCEQVKMVVDETNDTAFQIQSNACLRTAEMRLVAARKMEEAARAAEALAIAEMTILSNGVNQYQDGLCFPEPPRSPSTLQALMNEDSSTDISRIEILRKLEEANEEVKQSKQALEMASQRVEIASAKQRDAEDAFHHWNIESWKDQKAIKAKRLMKEDNFPRHSFLNHANQQHDLPKQMLKRNASVRNVLNRKQVHTNDEKQLVAPRRKFRFIHINLPETE